MIFNMEKLIKRIDFGHLMLVIFIEGAVIWYFYDAYTASSNIQNIILIAPASIIVIFLGLIVLYQIFRSDSIRVTDSTPLSQTHQRKPADDIPQSLDQLKEAAFLTSRFRTLIFILIFGLYIFFLDIIGFDIATYLFLGIIMVLQGERRVWLIVAYSLLFGTVTIWFFGLMIPYEMFTILVPN